MSDSLGICVARRSFKDMPAFGAGDSEAGRNLLVSYHMKESIIL